MNGESIFFMSDKPYTIIFVCTGNTCRSPMAEYLLKHALQNEEAPLSEVQVLSAGIAAGDGFPPSHNSVAAMENVGIDIGEHLTRHASPELLDQADLVLGMTLSHLYPLEEILGDDAEGKLHLMRDFIDDSDDPEIPDPFGMNIAAYEYARDSMVEAIPGILKFLKTQLNSTSS